MKSLTEIVGSIILKVIFPLVGQVIICALITLFVEPKLVYHQFKDNKSVITVFDGIHSLYHPLELSKLKEPDNGKLKEDIKQTIIVIYSLGSIILLLYFNYIPKKRKLWKGVTSELEMAESELKNILTIKPYLRFICASGVNIRHNLKNIDNSDDKQYCDLVFELSDQDKSNIFYVDEGGYFIPSGLIKSKVDGGIILDESIVSIRKRKNDSPAKQGYLIKEDGIKELKRGSSIISNTDFHSLRCERVHEFKSFLLELCSDSLCYTTEFFLYDIIRNRIDNEWMHDESFREELGKRSIKDGKRLIFLTPSQIRGILDDSYCYQKFWSYLRWHYEHQWRYLLLIRHEDKPLSLSSIKNTADYLDLKKFDTYINFIILQKTSSSWQRVVFAHNQNHYVKLFEEGALHKTELQHIESKVTVATMFCDWFDAVFNNSKNLFIDNDHLDKCVKENNKTGFRALLENSLSKFVDAY